MDHFAVITAGGRGARMGKELPKQFLPLHGDSPVLFNSIRAFYRFNPGIKILITLPGDYVSMWEKLAKEKDLGIPHRVIEGGKTRFHSVQNAISALRGKSGLVAIHDGARPFVTTRLIEALFKAAENKGSAIPVLPVKESLRKKIHGDYVHVERSEYFTVQTPQVFNLEKLTEAYKQVYHKSFTDDASVFESAGNDIFVLEGEKGNLKITYPHDYELARIILKEENINKK